MAEETKRRVKKHPGTDEKKVEALQEEIEIEEQKILEEPKKLEIEPSDISGWAPKTELGAKVKSGQITNIDTILDSGGHILEYQIVDRLMPSLETVFINAGQSKGKF